MCAVVVALFLLATGAYPVAADETDTRAAIQALLDERASALLAGDFAAFRATNGGGRRFRARQARMFQGFRQVPLADYRLVANWRRYGDLTRPQDVRRYPDADEIRVVLVEEHYRLDGYDERDAVEDLYLTVVREGEEWSVADDTPLDDLGLYSARHPWDFGPVATLETKVAGAPVLVVEPDRARCSELQPGFLDAVGEALRRVDAAWVADWPRRVVLVVPCSPGELRRMLQATFDPSKFVAFAYSTVDTSDGYRYTGHRVIINPPVIDGRPSSQVVTIMAHELLHVASRELAGPFIPLFVEEGIADWVGYAGSSEALAFFDAVVGAGGFDRELPPDHLFSVGGARDIFLSYQEAQSAMTFLAQRFSARKLVDFYRTLGRRTVAPGVTQWHVDHALRDAIGIGLRGFERVWADSIAG